MECTLKSCQMASFATRSVGGIPEHGSPSEADGGDTLLEAAARRAIFWKVIVEVAAHPLRSPHPRIVASTPTRLVGFFVQVGGPPANGYASSDVPWIANT